jgi:hypothetical protein
MERFARGINFLLSAELDQHAISKLNVTFCYTCAAGVVSCYIMERFAPGIIRFLLSAELEQVLNMSSKLDKLLFCGVCAAGVVSCYIMERFAPSINFLLSAELGPICHQKHVTLLFMLYLCRCCELLHHGAVCAAHQLSC